MKSKFFSRRFISAFVVAAMLLSAFGGLTVFAAREYAADFSIQGRTVQFVNEPYSKNDFIYVPVEELCGYLNLQLVKEGETYKLTRMGQTMELQSGNLIAYVGDTKVELPANPEEKNGVLYAPAELFSLGFGCPLTVAEDKRSADLTPNVYKVLIDENHAAAISAGTPDSDILVATNSGVDTLFYNITNFANQEKSLFYMIDLSSFAGKTIKKVELALNIDKAEYDPTLRMVRTAPWKKGEVTYNTQPAVYDKQYVDGRVAETGYADKVYDITSLANNAQLAGEELGIKLLGIPHSSKLTSLNMSFTVMGVKTTKAPYAIVTLDEGYTFPVKPDVKEASDDSTKYSEFELLKSLGVFTEDDEFPLDMNESVQRQEFVRYALRLRNTVAGEAGGEQFFSDVPTNSPYYNEIMTAHSLGLVVGWQGIAFRPYDSITIGEAITILGRMLNYNIYADERGGFTPGYFAAARQGDLYTGSSTEKQALSFNKMIDLMENALDAKMLDVTSYSSDGKAEYIFNEDMTVLSEYWNAKKLEGTVTANEYSNLIPGTDGKEDTIVIDSKSLKLSYEPYNDFLGYKVRGWYNDEDELLYLGTLEHDVTDIAINEIEGVSETGDSITVNYVKDSGKRAEETFRKSATVIYNGKSISQGNVTAGLITGADSGSIKLVGSNLVIIDAYATVIVYSVDAADEIIYDTYAAYDKVLRLGEADAWTLRDKDGKDVSLENIKRNDVISAAKSLDGKLINGIISTRKLSGTISMIEDANTPDAVVTIGGVEYEMANITRPEGAADYWTDRIKLGYSSTFLLDVYGNIVGMVTDKTEDILGYLLLIDYSGRSALSKDLQAAVLIEGNEEYITYDLAGKVEIDGTTYDNHEEILDLFMEDEYDTDGVTVIGSHFKKQGIIFGINSDGKINQIDTSYFDAEKEDKENSLQKRRNMSDRQIEFKEGTLEAKFVIKPTESLMVFCSSKRELTSEEKVQSHSYELDEFEVRTTGLGNDSKYNIELYTIGVETPHVMISLVNASSSDSVHYREEMMIADRFVTAFDEEGYEIKKMYYYSGTTAASIIVSEKAEDQIADIKRGDIVRFSKNASGEISAITEVYDYETKTMHVNRLTNFDHEAKTHGGYTTLVDGNMVKLSAEADTSDNVDYVWVDLSKIANFCRYEVDSSGITVYKATSADIRTVKNVEYNPTGAIFHFVWEMPRQNGYIIEMQQPAGTGIYKVSYTPGMDGVSAMPEAVRYNPGDIAAVTSVKPTAPDYEFLGWTVKGTEEPLYNEGATVAVNNDIVFVAKWAYNPTFEITFRDSDGQAESFKRDWARNDLSGNIVTRNLPTLEQATDEGFVKAGYRLIGWKDADGTSHELGAEFVPSEDTTFTAEWIKVWDGTTKTEPATEEIDGKTFYLISDGAELAWFANKVNTSTDKALNAKLTDNINLNYFDTEGNWYDNAENFAKANKWTVIGSFKGIFDGNGKTISGLYYPGSGTNGGMFGKADGDAVIKNLSLTDAYVTGGTSNRVYDAKTAVLCGEITGNVEINNVTVSGKVTNYTGKYISNSGGLVAYVQYGATNVVVKNCNSYVNIVADTYSGTSVDSATSSNKDVGNGIAGIIGSIAHYNSTAVTVDNCHNYGEINAPYSDRVAGVVGRDYAGYAAITNCTNSGNITGNVNVGGIIGVGKNSKHSAIGNTNSNTGTVTGNINAGNLYGFLR